MQILLALLILTMSIGLMQFVRDFQMIFAAVNFTTSSQNLTFTQNKTHEKPLPLFRFPFGNVFRV